MSAGKLLSAVAVIAAVAIVGLVLSTEDEAPSDVDTIRVSVVPDVDRAELDRRYRPLLEHIARETGLDLELVVPASYDDLLDRFERQEVDLAYFGGLTFIKAQLDYGARPLVMRDVDARFTTYFVVRGDGPLSGCANLMCADLAGKIMTFGSMLSTSGHLMPRHFLVQEKGIDPDTYFGEVRYSGAHDRTIYETRDGVSDLGAVNSEIYRSMHGDGRLAEGELEVVWETPPYPNYVWAVSDAVPREDLARLRDAYLMLDYSNPQHRSILSGMGAMSFLPAGVADFDRLRQVADSFGLTARR